MISIRGVLLAVLLLLGLGAWIGVSPAQAQVDLVIRVDVVPPPLPVYAQPPLPGLGYIWVPGYWAWSDDVGYYWVPGTWIRPPEPQLLWTPGYWGWENGVYIFHGGYWGPHIGFYGGVNYGFGYGGVGYGGGYWRDGAFFYNRTVNNFGGVAIANVYEKTVVVNNAANVSFNGPGGMTARPTAEETAAGQEHHVAPTSEQAHHAEAASKDPSLSLANNHGHPAVAAAAHAGEFKGPGVVAAHPGKPVAAVAPQGHSGANIGKGHPVGPNVGNKVEPTPKTTPKTTPKPSGSGSAAPAAADLKSNKERSDQPHTTAPKPPPSPSVASKPSAPHPAAKPPPPHPAAAPKPPPPHPAAAPKPKCEPGKPCH